MENNNNIGKSKTISCPKCKGKFKISWYSLYARMECKTCGCELKLKKQAIPYLLPAILSGLLITISFNIFAHYLKFAMPWTFLLTALIGALPSIILFMLMCRKAEYEED